jgi:hypothetical protein
MFLVGCIIILFLSIIIVPYLNNKLGLKKLDNPLGQDFLIGSPSIQYAAMIVFHKRAKKGLYNHYVFGNIDLHSNSRLIDKVLSYLFVLFACGGLVLVLITYGLQWLFT